MTDNIAKRIGKCKDALDNSLQWAFVRGPLFDRLLAMKAGMETASKELEAIYTEMTGENPWEELA